MQLNTSTVASAHPPREFTWTEAGRFRVAKLIQATLQYNCLAGLQPDSRRSLAKAAGMPYHNAVGGYTAGRITDPNRAGGRVLRSIAPYIYRAESFEVAAERSSSDRILKVVHKTPDRVVNPETCEYWRQPGLTYADDWTALIALGESSGAKLEQVIQQRPASPAERLVEIFQGLDSFRLGSVARLTGIPLPTFKALIGKDGSMDKSQFSSVAQVLQDFLVRKTPTKPDAWDLSGLVNAVGADGGIAEQRLGELLAGSGPSPSLQECSILSAVLREYGVPWSTAELEILASLPKAGQEPQQLPLTLPNPEQNGRVNGSQLNGQPTA